MSQPDAPIPVIIGVGQINDRPDNPADGLDSMGLMAAALRLADTDAGGNWLPQLDSLAVVDQISFPQLGHIATPLVAALGATPRLCEQTPMASGDSPILLLNQAANRIATGEITVAAIVGGEALRTAARRAAAAAGDAPSAHSAIGRAASSSAPDFRQRFGLVTPVDVYPLYENATRAAYGQTLDAGQAETAEIWSRFSEVAANNPAAWLRTAIPAEQIRTPTADNRPLAHPYLKLMVANSSVNQGAGFIVTSLAHARAQGVPDHRIVYIGHGAAAHEPDDFLTRDRYDRSPSMIASLQHAMEANHVTADDLDCVELYSCFPCVPKMARRAMNWPLEKPATVFGGLTFGGGPIGNYMSHAVVSMVERLRAGARRGLLFANGGFASHNHTILLSATPTGLSFPQDFNVQPQAEAARGPLPSLDETYQGPAVIETYTVLYNRDATPRLGVIVARTPTGDRALAKVPSTNQATLSFLTTGTPEPVGTAGMVDAQAEWQRQ